jgi:hypothetical protein
MKMYAVMGLFREFTTQAGYTTITNCAGVIPVFATREEAEEFSGGKWQIMVVEAVETIINETIINGDGHDQ